MSTAIAAYGTLLQRDPGTGFVSIAEVTKITPPALKLDTVDVSADPITGLFTVTAATTSMAIAVTYATPAGTVLRFTTTGTLPSGLALLTDYYVLTSVAGVATVALTLGGVAITFADVGTGVHTFNEQRSWRQNIATLKDAGEVTLDLNFIPTNATQSFAAGLIQDLSNKTLRNFKVIFPDATTWLFSGFVSGFKSSAAVAGALTAVVTLRLTGAPTLV